MHLDASRFDALTRVFGATRSRRQTLAALTLGALALAKSAEGSTAGPGCKDVNAKCQKANDCCSGICKGKKGKKKCKAHDASTCLAGQNSCGIKEDIACRTTAGVKGSCFTTTGNAPYCGADGDCFACTKDADCKAAFGQQAACIDCADCPETGNVACVGINRNVIE